MIKILYVEDNDDNVYMLKMRLELLGDFEVLAAEDGEKGCEIALRERPDIILMDLQYVPALLTPAKKDKAIAMVKAISELARDAGVNVFRRFAFMKGMSEVEQVSFDRMIDPGDEHRLHDSDWATGRISWALRIAIVGGVDKAPSS